MLSDAERDRIGAPMINLPPALPPSGTPPLPLPDWADRPDPSPPGYPAATPMPPPLEGSPIQPLSPEDLIIEQSNSKILGDSLRAGGESPPADGYEAHHMVPSNAGGPAMDALRSRLAGMGLDLNTAANGVWLPGSDSTPVVGEPAYHPRLNNTEYLSAVDDAFRNVTTVDQALAVLADIKSQLQNGTFPGIRPRP